MGALPTHTVGPLPTHTEGRPGGWGVGGGRVAPPRHCWQHPSTVRLPCQPSAGGAFGTHTAYTTHTTHTTHNTQHSQTTHITTKIFHFDVSWAAEKKSLPKIPPRPYKTKKFKRPRSKSNGARNYTLARKHLRSAHRTPSISPSWDTPRFSALRWNFCASAVRSCPCGLPCLRAAATASFS